MRLQFFIHGLTGGGSERVMAILANEFVKDGHEVEIVLTSSELPPVYVLDKRVNLRYLSYPSPNPIQRLYNIFLHRCQLRRLNRSRKCVSRYKPDYVISFNVPQNIEFLKALKDVSIPKIVCEHTNVTRELNSKMISERDVYYPYADAITVLTQRDYNLWKDKYNNVYYLPNPCDIEPYTKTNMRSKTILACGRVDQWNIKGFDNLIIAWSSIKNNHLDWKCQIAGSYKQESLKALQEAVGNDDAFKSVEFLGFRKDIGHLMANSEIFCLSSRTEGMPMTLLEALNYGCACISFDCTTGPSEIIDDGITGILVKDQDVNELAKKLDQVIEDSELRICLQKNSFLAVQKFGKDKIVQMWYNLFNSIR